MSAADLVIPSNEKGIPEYNSLCDYQAKLHLLFASAAADQLRSHKGRAGHCSREDYLKQEMIVPDPKPGMLWFSVF